MDSFLTSFTGASPLSSASTAQPSQSTLLHAQTSHETCLRQRQIQAVLSMLNFNRPATMDGNSMTQQLQQQQQQGAVEPVWKILIYDQFGCDIISPLLKVSDLRDQGVTVHMLLHADREPIDDAPAIYFMEPTSANIARLSDDLAKNLYESFYVNFSSALPRTLLEELAAKTLQYGSSPLISQLFDQYLTFLCPEKNMFSLNLVNSYRLLNNPKTTETEIDAFVDTVANSLLSVLVTAEVIPFIRCARGNAAEMIARKLDGRLRDRILNSRGDVYVENALAAHVQRPVLIILDRNIDLCSMLAHNWSYQGLVHDALELKSNRISFFTEEKGRNVRKIYDVDINDTFWEHNAGSPFPQMTEDLDSALTQYKKETEEITRSCGVNSLEEISSMDINASAIYLKNAVTMLPKLTEKKRTVDMHMNVASALLKAINERSLDSFILAEESIGKQTKSQLLELLNGKGSVEDKMRLFLIYFLSSEAEVSKEDLNDLVSALQNAGCPLELLKAVEYAKSVRLISRMTAMANVQQAPSTFKGNDILGKFSTISGKFADNLKDAGFGNTFDTIVSGLKNILPSNKNLPVASITESLMESNTGGSSALGSLSGAMSSTPDDDYLFFNPKQARSNQRPVKPSRTVYQEAFVFVVGGGNYIEYQNLQQLAQKLGPGRRITYGCTEILNASSFLSQISSIPN